VTRRIRKITEIIPDEREDERESIISDPVEDTYSSYVASQSGLEGVVVKVYRQSEKGRQYCFMGPPAEISDESVRLYHARQPWAREEGMYFLKVLVHGDPRTEFSIPIAPQVGTLGAAGPGADGGADHAVVRLLMEQNARLEALVMRGNQAEREPLGATVDALYKLDQMRGAKELPMDTLMKAIELGKTLSGGSGVAADGSEWMGLIKEAIPIFGSMLARQPQQPPQQAQITGGQPMTTEAQEDAQLRGVIAFLKKKCLAGSHPELYIEIVADNYEDDATYQRLVSRVLDREFSEFAALDPDITKPTFEPFFRFLFNGLRSRFKPENPMEPTSAGQSGHTSNTSGNGAGRTKRSKKS
jgi:hypothetical protein